MTKTKQQKSIITRIVAGIIAIGLVTSLSISSVDALPREQCPSGEVQHWNKIVFEVNKDKNNPKTGVPLEEKMDVVVRATPGELFVIHDAIEERLADEFDIPKTQIDKLEIDVTEVKYDTVTCGLRGPEGPPGPTGIVTITKRTADDFTFLRPGALTDSSRVSCLEGEQITGGGWIVLQRLFSDELIVRVNGEVPGIPNHWGVSADAPATNANDIGLKAIVYCANISP